MSTVWTDMRTLWIAQLLMVTSFVCRIESETVITTSCEHVWVVEGESTTLSCIFTEEVAKLHKDFKVELHSNTDNSSFPVLLCHWSESGIRDCYEHEGYTYGGHKGNSISLKVLRASLGDTGQYSCVLLSYSIPGTYDKCNLTVQASNKSPPTSTPHTTTIKAANIEERGTFGSEQWTIILGAIMAIIIILLIVGIILLIRRWICNRQDTKNSQQGSDTNISQHETKPLTKDNGFKHNLMKEQT